MPTGKAETYGFIDAMRGYAILLVIAVHVWHVPGALTPWFQRVVEYGQMGVQLFFVVSALTLCLSYARRGDERQPVAKFAIRRFFRIAPLYYLGILIYGGLSLLLHAPTLSAYTPVNVAANVLFLHGLFPPAINTVVPGGWSIGVEMLFYALFPLLFVLAHRWYERWGVRALWGLTGAAIAGNFVAQTALHLVWKPMENVSFAYFSIINQLPVFLLGMTLYFSGRQGVVQPHRRGMAVNAAAFALLTALGFVLWSVGGLAFALIPTVAGLSFVFLVRLVRDVPALRPRTIRRIGQVSYSMYIFHFIFASYLVSAIAQRTLTSANPYVAFVLSYLVVVACTFGVALLSERHIERHGIALGKRLIDRINTRLKPAPAPPAFPTSVE